MGWQWQNAAEVKTNYAGWIVQYLARNIASRFLILSSDEDTDFNLDPFGTDFSLRDNWGEEAPEPNANDNL